MNLDRGKRQLADDVRVLDRESFFNGFTLDPLCGHGGAGDGRTTAEGLELGFFNDVRLRIDLHLQLHHVAALWRAHQSGPDVGIFLGEAADVARIIVMINYFCAVCHGPVAPSKYSFPESQPFAAAASAAPKPAFLMAFSVKAMLVKNAERPAASSRNASRMYSAPSPRTCRNSRTS